MLKQRIITAVIMALVLLLALLYLPGDGFMLAIMAVFAVAGWEWAAMSGLAGQLSRWFYALAVFVLIAAVACYAQLHDRPDVLKVRDVLGIGGIWWAVSLLWVMSYPASAALWGSRIMRLLMGFLVLVPAAIALMYLFSLPYGKTCFVYMVAIVASADIGAYFTGRAFGKRKLAPHVSPGKSWAGFFGGLASCALLAAIVGQWGIVDGLAALELLLMTLLAALASVLGDLVESMVKRQRGIKDSSRLLPGHGGVMDRIDSVTAAAPVFVLLLILLTAGGR